MALHQYTAAFQYLLDGEFRMVMGDEGPHGVGQGYDDARDDKHHEAEADDDLHQDGQSEDEPEALVAGEEVSRVGEIVLACGCQMCIVEAVLHGQHGE